MNQTLNLTPMFDHLNVAVVVEVATDGDTTNATIKWTDGINAWEETYGSLSTALARLSMLAYCGEDDWESCFTTTDLEFVRSFDDWATSQVA